MMFCSKDPDADVVEENAKQCVRDFVSLSNVLEGHQKRRVTPYMHIFAYHVPYSIRQHGNIRKFSGQGIDRYTVMCIDYNPCCCRCQKEQ